MALGVVGVERQELCRSLELLLPRVENSLTTDEARDAFFCYATLALQRPAGASPHDGRRSEALMRIARDASA